MGVEARGSALRVGNPRVILSLSEAQICQGQELRQIAFAHSISHYTRGLVIAQLRGSNTDRGI